MAFPWGVWFEPVQPVARIVELAQPRRSAKGPRCASSPTRAPTATCTSRSPRSLLGTERMVVAPAITNPFSRHPVTTAAAHRDARRARAGSCVARPRRRRQPRARPARAGPRAAVTPRCATRSRSTAPCSGAARSVPPGCRGRRSRCRSRSPGAGPRVQALAAAEADWVDAVRRAARVAPDRGSPAPRERLQGRVVRVPRVRARATAAGARPLLLHGARRAAGDPRACRPRPTSASARSAPRCWPGASTRPRRCSPTRWSTSTRSPARPMSARARIAALASSFDLFMLPMNDIEQCEQHIVASADILRRAQQGTA